MNSIFFGLTLALSASDLTYHRLPNRLVWALMALAVVKSPLEATAALAGGGLMGLIYLVSGGRLGLGDVKLFAALAGYVGWSNVVGLFVRSWLLAGLAGGLWLIKNGTSAQQLIPLGPVLCLAAWLSQ